MVHDEALAVVCPDITFRERFAFSVSALIGVLDSRHGTIGCINALNQSTAYRYHPAITYWTEHLSSPLKVRKILLLMFIIS
jgi:hypothetical protein